MLANMRDQIWTAFRTLVEGKGMTFEDCLNLTLRILPLLLQVPMDVSYKTQIPLIITYCPESSIYRRWHAEHGRVSPFCKEVRASQTLTKVLGGIHHQNSEGVDCTPSAATSEGSAGLDRLQGSRARSVAIPRVSPYTTAIDQVPPTPRPLKMTWNPSVGPSPPMQKRTLPMMTNMQRFVRVTVQS